jgi:hypothetical protein
LRILDRRKRASDKLEGKVSDEQGDICVFARQSLVQTKSQITSQVPPGPFI